MHEFNFADPADRARAINESIASKQRVKVDNQGRPIDPDAPRTLYHYDPAGVLTGVKTVTADPGDDAA